MNTTLPARMKFNKLYEAHLKYLQLNGYQPKTISAYSRAMRRVGNYFDGHVENLSKEQLLNYFSDLLQSHSWSSVKLDLYGLRFFYKKVLEKTWEDIPLVKKPRTKNIPDVLTTTEICELVNATNRLSYKVFFFVIYTMGLRLGEGIGLKVGDIDTDRMRVHIRMAKGNKDRFVPLPEKTLQVLRQFWQLHKHPDFIFPNRKRGIDNAQLADSPLARNGIQIAIKNVVRQIGIKKKYPVIPCATAMQPICSKQVLI